MMILKTSRANLSSNDQLSLDLPFAATKSLTARVGPTPTFTRGSGATYIGSDGRIHGVDTSTTSNTIGTGSRTFTLAATAGQDQFWRAGDAVEASNGSNFMVGTVTNYSVALQLLVCNMISANGSGTFTSWRIGYRGPRFDHDPVGRTNLLTWSEEFNNTSGWLQSLGFATANQTTSPSGNNDADLLSARNTSYGGILRRAVAPAYAANTTYTMSVYAKAGTHQFIGLRLSGPSAGGGGNAYSVFTLSGSGSATAPTPTSGTINSVSCVSAGGGWYRCTLVYTTGSTVPNNTTDIAICQSNGNTNFAPAGTETVYLWGAQLEAGSFATSYIPTTTAPVTIRDCRGLLIEEGRTNLCLRSEEFDQWMRGGTLAPTINAQVSPSGATNADKIVETATTGFHSTWRILDLGSLSRVTFSIYAKAAERSWIQVLCGNGFPSDSSAYFNLSTGAVGNKAAGVDASIQPMGNGWYRCSVSATPTSSTINGFYVSIASENGVHIYTGDGVSGLFVWGAQVEAGSFPTSYIPTTTGSVVRSADVCSITGDNFSGFYNQSEGTVVAVVSEFRRGIAYVPIVRFAISSDAAANRFQIGTNGNKTGDSSPIEFIGLKANVPQYQSYLTSPTPESRAALAYKTDDIRGALNGTLSAADSPPSEILAGANLMTIGTLGLHIESIRYYRKRLPNAKLVTLTT
jgi:hypothetical protein